MRLTNWGMEIRGIAIHEALDNGGKWLSMPSRSYVDKDGKLKWSYVLEIYDKDRKRRFDREVFDALERYRGDERS